MERILIKEIDNTSNVEALSSYDVVYVPGFATNDASPLFNDGPTLYRTPTFVSTKYEFYKLFGDTCPTFPKDQPYPIADETKYGFPKYAIPDFREQVDPEQISRLNNIPCTETDRDGIIAAVTGAGGELSYYIAIDDNVEDPTWEPEDGITYYVGVVETGVVKMKTLPVGTDDYSQLVIFRSNTSPVENGWAEYINGEIYLTDDIEIEFAENDEVKVYYSAIENNIALMFKGPTASSIGDADPGYRYAECLLSLGIPIYYEQMNAKFVEVNMEDLSIWKEDEEGNINPVLNEWCEKFGSLYIKTADTSVQIGKIYYVGADISIESLYTGLEARFSNKSADATTPADYSFDSMGDYPVKYLTSGGYPLFEYGPLGSDGFGTSPIAEQMIRLAAEREDAIGLIDHTNNPNRSIYETDRYSVIRRVRESLTTFDDVTGTYGAMFTPWYTCTHDAITGGVNHNYEAQMPASLAFLTALAAQLKHYNPWLAVSGVVRGQVPYCGGLHTNYTLSNNVADSYQMLPGDIQAQTPGGIISINPITNIRNYGYCIWGNRTLRNNASGTKATSFLNIRDTVSDIKKRLFEASRNLLFEQNTEVLWVNFKAQVVPLLETMKANYILDDYTITKYKIHPDTGEPIPAYKVFAIIKVVPINSVEQFELQIHLENENLNIVESE